MVFLGGFLTEVSKHNAEASLARWSGPPASMELAFLDPKGPKKGGETLQCLIFDFGSYIWIVGPKTIWQNSWTSYGSLLRNLLITSQRWHVPKKKENKKNQQRIMLNYSESW